jgi:hypothetical protein
MNAVVNSVTSVFSHDIPIALDLQPRQIPASGASLSLISGLGLGHAGCSQRVVVTGSFCVLTGWLSDSSLICKVIAGSERRVDGAVAVSTGGLGFQASQCFCFV